MKILILLVSLFILNQAQILSQQQNKENQLIISLENLENEAVINFQNQNSQFVDQVFCQRSKCECIFTQTNISEEQIEILECNENKLIIQRNNSELIASLGSSSQRRMLEAYSDSDMTDSKTIDSRLTIKWKFNSDGTIEFATIWNKKTWLGIGFGSSMTNVDMITLNISGSTVELLDLYSTSANTPPTDSQQDYILISYEVGTASVKARFKRKLSTGDSKDKTLTKGSSYNWCYAYSSALVMERHTVNLGFSITLSDSGTTSTGSTGSGSTSTGSGSTSTGSGSTSTGSGSSDTTSGSNDSDSENDNENSENEDSDSDSDSDSDTTITSRTSFQIQLGILCMIQIMLF